MGVIHDRWAAYKRAQLAAAVADADGTSVPVPADPADDGKVVTAQGGELVLAAPTGGGGVSGARWGYGSTDVSGGGQILLPLNSTTLRTDVIGSAISDTGQMLTADALFVCTLFVWAQDGTDKTLEAVLADDGPTTPLFAMRENAPNGLTLTVAINAALSGASIPNQIYPLVQAIGDCTTVQWNLFVQAFG